MRCSRTLELLSRKLDHAISWKEREALREHLVSCVKCRDLQAKIESDSLNLKRIFHFLAIDRKDFARRTLALIREREDPYDLSERELAGGRFHRLFWAATVAGLAASLVLIGYLVLIHVPGQVREIARLSDIVLHSSAPHLEESLVRLSPENTEAPVPDSPRPVTSPPALATEMEDREGRARAGQFPPNDEGLEGAPTPEKIIENLIAAIHQGDESSIEEWKAALVAIRAQADSMSSLLIAYYDDESDLSVKVKLLESLNLLSGSHLQDFYLRELATQESVDLKRALVAGLYQNIEAGTPPIEGITDRLVYLLQDPQEDYRVRSYAAAGLLLDIEMSGNNDILELIKRTALETPDDRLRINLIQSITDANLSLLTGAQIDQINEFYADVLSASSDYDVAVQSIEGLTRSPDRTSAMESIRQVLMKNPERLTDELRNHIRRALEALEDRIRNSNSFEDEGEGQ